MVIELSVITLSTISHCAVFEKQSTQAHHTSNCTGMKWIVFVSSHTRGSFTYSSLHLPTNHLAGLEQPTHTFREVSQKQFVQLFHVLGNLKPQLLNPFSPSHFYPAVATAVQHQILCSVLLTIVVWLSRWLSNTQSFPSFPFSRINKTTKTTMQ